MPSPRTGLARLDGLLMVALVGLLAATAALAVSTARVRYARDVARVVFNDNTEALEQLRAAAEVEQDSVRSAISALPTLPPPNQPILVISLADLRLWYRLRDSVLFTAPIAAGSGKELVVRGTSRILRFETPRGRLRVERLDSAPVWIPPDWHYIEQANKRGLGLVHLQRGTPIPLRDGSTLQVEGSEVVRRTPDGGRQLQTAADGREIVADGAIVIPPFGTTQRKYLGVLGDFRLYLGDGYGIHGTTVPSSIGHAVTHGCIRLRNQDIATLYHTVPLGTPVYIY